MKSHRSGNSNNDYLKRSNEWEKERERKRDNLKSHRSGNSNNDYLKRSNEWEKERERKKDY